MQYREEKARTIRSKQEYLSGLDLLIEKKMEETERSRRLYAKRIFEDTERYRSDLKALLGWPLVDHFDAEIPRASSELLAEEDGFCLYRMQLEILEGLKLTGLLFKANGDGRKPLVLVQHGGDGTPEVISGIEGDTYNYNEMLERVLKYGVHVFAPQLLLWSKGYGLENGRAAIDGKLKMIGGSITAVEIYGLMRILDYFETQAYVSTFGMVGLSYGGFYTLFTAALETRIKAAISCAFFNTRKQNPRCDWTWFDFAEKFDDAEIACMVYPRKLCIQIAKQDQVFDHRYGAESFEKLKELCADVGVDWVDMISFDGRHEFCKDNEPIEKLVQELISKR